MLVYIPLRSLVWGGYGYGWALTGGELPKTGAGTLKLWSMPTCC
jgi:hypothetical protein